MRKFWFVFSKEQFMWWETSMSICLNLIFWEKANLNWCVYLWPEKLMVLLVLFYLNSVIYEPLSLCDYDRKQPYILQFGTNIFLPISGVFCHSKNEKKCWNSIQCSIIYKIIKKKYSAMIKFQNKFMKETCRLELFEWYFFYTKSLIFSTHK